jgi:hypothetical protein
MTWQNASAHKRLHDRMKNGISGMRKRREKAKARKKARKERR